MSSWAVSCESLSCASHVALATLSIAARMNLMMSLHSSLAGMPLWLLVLPSDSFAYIGSLVPHRRHRFKAFFVRHQGHTCGSEGSDT